MNKEVHYRVSYRLTFQCYNNFSDHRPISIVFSLPFSHAVDNEANKYSKRFAVAGTNVI